MAKERDIRVEIMKNDEKNKGKPEAILVKIVEGGLQQVAGRNHAAGPAVREGRQAHDREAAARAPRRRSLRFARLEVGAGIEKKKDDFVAEVKAQAEAQKLKDAEKK